MCSYDKLNSLDSEPSEGVKAANLANCPIPPEIPTGSMTFEVAFLGKIPWLPVFLENLPWGLPREILPIFFFLKHEVLSGSNPPRWWNFKGRAHIPTTNSGNKTAKAREAHTATSMSDHFIIYKAELQGILTLCQLHTTGRPVQLRMVIGEEKTDRHGTRHRTGKQRVIKPFSFSPSRSKYKAALRWQS